MVLASAPVPSIYQGQRLRSPRATRASGSGPLEVRGRYQGQRPKGGKQKRAPA